MQARELLTQAAAIYDDPHNTIATMAANEGWQTIFASGAAWMRAVMAHVRGMPIPERDAPYNLFGFVKYGLASLGALLYLAAIMTQGWWVLLPGFILIFYAIEAQMVFLFPLVIDGHPQPFAVSRAWTQRAGGTLAVLIIVLQLAAVMLVGGWLGRGFVRSWALGCIAVVIWYEGLRHAEVRLA
jgi:hypothetical protein